MLQAGALARECSKSPCQLQWIWFCLLLGCRCLSFGVCFIQGAFCPWIVADAVCLWEGGRFRASYSAVWLMPPTFRYSSNIWTYAFGLKCPSYEISCVSKCAPACGYALVYVFYGKLCNAISMSCNLVTLLRSYLKIFPLWPGLFITSAPFWRIYPSSSKSTLHLNDIHIHILHTVKYSSKDSAWECCASQ